LLQIYFRLQSAKLIEIGQDLRKILAEVYSRVFMDHTGTLWTRHKLSAPTGQWTAFTHSM